LLSLSFGHPERPLPALLYAVYLWGCHLSQSESYKANESIFLSRALIGSSNSLSSDHPQKVIHSIQAEVLLATYFFRSNRLVEGRYHLGAAVSLTIGAKLHQIRAPGVDTSRADILPPPANQLEEGERLNAFWTVFTLNNCWGTSGGSGITSVFDNPGSQIDSPWPMEMSHYERVSRKTSG
jgi:hypothetical protein